MNKTFTRWYLLTVVMACGAIPLWRFGVFSDIYYADITKISFVIYAAFIISIILTGITALRVSKDIEDREYTIRTGKYINTCWFLSETMMTLGLIGTVSGMIYLFGQIFVEIDPTNPEDLKQALSHMATGLSTAMYTTICGMVGALLSKVHLMNIEFGQESANGTQ